MPNYKRVDLSGMTAQEKAALAQWVKDFKHAAPQMQEAQRVAHDMFVGMLRSPQWHIHEGIHQGQAPPQQREWSIGAPQVNYVDYIEPIGRQHESAIADHPTDR